MRDTQRDSQSYIENREEGDRGDQEEKRGSQRGEANLASNQFPKCSPQHGTPREIHSVK